MFADLGSVLCEETGMNKDEKLQITKDKLMEATLHLMENMEDPMKVTSREIAQKAQVQPAMINYCFGSRENKSISLLFRRMRSRRSFLQTSNRRRS